MTERPAANASTTRTRGPRGSLLSIALLVLALGALTFVGVSGCDSGQKSATMPSPMADSGRDTPPPGAGGAADAEYVKRPRPAFRFEDIAAAAGFTDVNHSGTSGVKEYLVEAVGPGPACLDFDHDGLMDFYVPDGDVFANYDLVKEADTMRPGELRPALRPKEKKPEPHFDHLYRNLGNGKFEDVAAKAGVLDDRWSFGALAWDYDGDGWTDLFVANLGKCRLYHNEGNGTFRDVAEELGVAGDDVSWNTCATCGDFDGDGRLDLYVARYADPAAEVEKRRLEAGIREGTPPSEIPGRKCLWRGIPAYCGPVGLVAQHDSLYRQTAGGRFEDVSEEMGVRPKAAKYGFTSYFFDYDRDGLLDIYVANDSEENFLWHQERDKSGKIHFTDVAELLGVKFGQDGKPQASMGCATADINQDGLLDVFVTNFSHDYNNIYIGVQYPGGVSFKDRGLQVMGQAVFYDLSWGCGFYDFDNDADLDLYIANGHVYKEVDQFQNVATTYAQFPAVFECLEARNKETGIGRYREVGPKPLKGPNARPPKWLTYDDEYGIYAGSGLEVKKTCRAACFNDFDNDGDVDILELSMNDTPIFLKNDLPASPSHRWLKLIPRMDEPGSASTGHNTEAIGATVLVSTPGGPTQMFPVYRCQSFLGTDDPRIPVGVGAAETATVTVLWPGPKETRKQTVYENLATDAAYVLRPDGKAERVDLPKVR